MLAEPTVVERADQPYVAIRALVAMEELGAVVPPLNAEVFGWLAARGAAATGAPFWKYNVIDMERKLEVEAGVTVAAAATGDERAGWWKRALEVWPDYEGYQAKTDRQIPVFLLEPIS